MLTFAILHYIAYLDLRYGSHCILQNQKRKQKRIKNKKNRFYSLCIYYLFLKNERRKKDEVK